jgi:hypothetical protein
MVLVTGTMNSMASCPLRTCIIIKKGLEAVYKGIYL